MGRSIIKSVSYAEQARELIRGLIFNGVYGPGAWLKEATLSQKLEISRSPIREALQSLAEEGLVTMVPNRGAFVSNLSLKQILDLCEVRKALETLSARLTTERASSKELESLAEPLEVMRRTIDGGKIPNLLYPQDIDLEFHRGICQLTGNLKLCKEVSEIYGQLRLIRLQVAFKPGRVERIYTEHVAIYEALKRRNPAEAEAEMGHHLQNALDNLLEVLTNKSASASTTWDTSGSFEDRSYGGNIQPL